jgi:hypothetical protein
MSKVLVLRVKGQYFREIQAGVKTLEYRLQTDYWSKRLVGREYEAVEVTLGYPKAADSERHLRFPWRGFFETSVQHAHFGAARADVFAIRLAEL